ncbi:MAG: hypothetical protein ABUL60_12040 [Myxococcales bacterium]
MIAWTRNSWLWAGALACLACSGGSRAGGALPASGGGGGSKSIAASPTPDGGDESTDTAGGAGGATPQGDGAASGSDDEAGGAPGAAGQGAAGEASTGGAAPWMEPEHEPVCVPAGELTNAKKLAISTDDVDQLGGISADELVIAWTVVANEQVTLHYAQRADLAAEFTAPKTVSIPAASDSVSLSADGLRLVYVNADRKGFGQLVRATTDAPFELVDPQDFALILESTALFAADEYVGDPVLGPDNSSLVYSRYGAGRHATLLLSERFSPFAPWPEGSPLPVTARLEATEAGRLRPTALSVDLETLFLWDSVAGVQRVAVLGHDTRKYDLSLDLGDARGAAPNSACTRVFYDSAGDLWTADFGATP